VSVKEEQLLEFNEVLDAFWSAVSDYGPDWVDPHGGDSASRCLYLYDDRVRLDRGRGGVCRWVWREDLLRLGLHVSVWNGVRDAAVEAELAGGGGGSGAGRVRCVVGEVVWRARGVQLDAYASGVPSVCRVPGEVEGRGDGIACTKEARDLLQVLQERADRGVSWGTLLVGVKEARSEV
jgi:hypothetical protein